MGDAARRARAQVHGRRSHAPAQTSAIRTIPSRTADRPLPGPARRRRRSRRASRRPRGGARGRSSCDPPGDLEATRLGRAAGRRVPAAVPPARGRRAVGAERRLIWLRVRRRPSACGGVGEVLIGSGTDGIRARLGSVMESSGIPRGIRWDSVGIPRGIRLESVGIPRGIRVESGAGSACDCSLPAALWRAPTPKGGKRGSPWDPIAVGFRMPVAPTSTIRALSSGSAPYPLEHVGADEPVSQFPVAVDQAEGDRAEGDDEPRRRPSRRAAVSVLS